MKYEITLEVRFTVEADSDEQAMGLADDIMLDNATMTEDSGPDNVRHKVIAVSQRDS